MGEDKKKHAVQNNILTDEQDAILDMYLERLDDYFENVKEHEKMEVEIETLHLKRILTNK